MILLHNRNLPLVPCIHARIQTRIHTCAFVCARTNVGLHIYVRKHELAHERIHMHTHAYTSLHMHTHTDTHTHVHAQTEHIRSSNVYVSCCDHVEGNIETLCLTTANDNGSEVRYHRNTTSWIRPNLLALSWVLWQSGVTTGTPRVGII